MCLFKIRKTSTAQNLGFLKTINMHFFYIEKISSLKNKKSYFSNMEKGIFTTNDTW